MTVVPAIISKDQAELDTMLAKIKEHGRAQLDVMDGEFVPNTSLNFDLKLQKGVYYEAHLMVANPGAWIDEHGDKVDLIIIHFEAGDVANVIAKIKAKGKKVGVALNPSTPIDKVFNFDLDLVLIMTVEPGFYGSKFLPETLNKVREMRKFNKNITIEVDGGIVPGTAMLAKKAGANIFVSGSYIMKSPNPMGAIKKIETDVA